MLFRSSLAEARRVFVTEAWSGRSFDAGELGVVLARAGIETDTVAEPGIAFEAALQCAKREQLPLVVYGSSYLLSHVL